MNRQKIVKRMILAVAGFSLLLMGLFPQSLWASHGDRLVIRGNIGDLGMLLFNQGHGGNHYAQEQNRHRGDRRGHSVRNTTYRDHRQPPHRGYGNPGFHKPHRGHRHPQPNHYRGRRHHHPRADHCDWNRRGWR